MRENLPKEMNFVYEATNAARARDDFKDVRTSLYIPEMIYATPRVLIMEFIGGGRVDDLGYRARLFCPSATTLLTYTPQWPNVISTEIWLLWS